jgi:hypothetical protein
MNNEIENDEWKKVPLAVDEHHKMITEEKNSDMKESVIISRLRSEADQWNSNYKKVSKEFEDYRNNALTTERINSDKIKNLEIKIKDQEMKIFKLQVEKTTYQDMFENLIEKVVEK